MSILLRRETPADLAAIDGVLERAFGGRSESRIVAAVRAASEPYLAFVAELASGAEVVGYILFSQVTVEDRDEAYPAIALGPMAVDPRNQRAGIGSRLVHHGLEACRRAGHRLVVVLGHPQYYPRFGFRPASRFDVRCPWEVPDDVFMLHELIPGGADKVHGTVRYHPAFDA